MGFWSRIFNRPSRTPPSEHDPKRASQGPSAAPLSRPPHATSPAGHSAPGADDPLAQLGALAARVQREGGSVVDDEALLRLFQPLRSSPAEGRALDVLLSVASQLSEAVRVVLAGVLVDRGEKPRAFDVLRDVSSPQGLLLFADLAYERGDLAVAVSTVERVLIRLYDYPGARERHARWALELGVDRGARPVPQGATTMVARDADAPFRLLREVARGGAGAVYEAEDLALQRRVALKIYHEPDRDRDQLVAEARAACTLDGPYTLRVFDLDPDQGWIAYEWARFGAVRDYLRVQDTSFLLPLVRWLYPLAAGLERVHQAGWVHNDVKPANVLFLAPDLPVLADFGISRTAGSPAPRGSMGYMSPERLAGRASHPRDDIYGFGRLLEDVLAQNKDPRVETQFRPLAMACVGPDAGRPADGRALATRFRVEWGA